VAYIKGLDLVDIIRMLRGVTNGGWDPKKTNNFHLYTLVLATQTLHATGYAMGIGYDGACSTGNLEKDEAVMVYSVTGPPARATRTKPSFLPRVTKPAGFLPPEQPLGDFCSGAGPIQDATV